MPVAPRGVEAADPVLQPQLTGSVQRGAPGSRVPAVMNSLTPASQKLVFPGSLCIAPDGTWVLGSLSQRA